VVEQIVTNLLVEPAISQQAVERNYGSLLGSVGLCSIVSLESITRQDLLDAGVQHGHAMPVLRALQTLPVAIPAFSPPPGAPPESLLHSVAKVSGSKVKEYPVLGPTGYPMKSEWRAWIPKFKGHMRGRVAPDWLKLVGDVLANPNAVMDGAYTPDDDNNYILWNELINAGDGMPVRLLELLPTEVVDEEHGIEALVHIGQNIEAASDETAEVIVEWLTTPPIVTEAKKYTLAASLKEWGNQLRTAVKMGAGLTEVQQRLSLKKMTSKLSEVQDDWKAEKAKTRPHEPAVKDLLVVI
jgi:hypothetical protein